MKMLITGGAGFVGSHLCDKYVREGNEVVCLDIGDLSNVAHLLDDKKHFRKSTTDITDWLSLSRFIGLEGFDVIIHLAAQIRVDKAISNPSFTWKVNVSGTYNLLESARMYDVKKFLFASSSEVYGSAQYTPIDERHPLGTNSIYGASKIAGDRICHAYACTYGMDIGILRPFNIYGPGQTAGVASIFIDKVLNNQSPLIQGDGSQSRDYIYIEDIVSAYDCMLRDRNPGTVNFGSGSETTVKKLAETIINICKKDIKPEYHDAPPNTTMSLVADISKAKKLGWEPKYNLEDGLMKFINWYKENKK
jgi:UDP-glucose 4-epimerase